ncbi:hypothetical protein AXF42_Ash013080 [Apostasia shenzhenica]|uniref:Small ribosomal subunit protein mS41 SAM domain-containing protein n=1 Tax=Apostasia shenzhenica TaxID=1088818 RepID=A0A2I0BD35_9ASPA|nr:hypothetical protein AXF42_Ash013080 [Apostasia shenzhenica]
MAIVARCWRRFGGNGIPAADLPAMLGLSAVRSYHRPPYSVKVGIPDFLNGVGNGVEAHAAKLEAEIGDLEKLLVTRTLKLKKLGIPCKHRKLILKYTHKFKMGLWRPRAESWKA